MPLHSLYQLREAEAGFLCLTLSPQYLASLQIEYKDLGLNPSFDIPADQVKVKKSLRQFPLVPPKEKEIFLYQINVQIELNQMRILE